MAQTAHKIPTSTRENGFSETNSSHHNEPGLMSTLSPNNQQTSIPLVSLNNHKTSTPMVSPNNQQNSTFSPQFPTANEHPIIIPGSTNEQTNSELLDEQEFFKKNRGWLMIVAILAAGSTYQAGLNPPGSFWQDSQKTEDGLHVVAGNPILYDKDRDRYEAFFYPNAASFVSSLIIIILLMNKHFYLKPLRIKVLTITMVLDLFSFMVAFAAGSCRTVGTSFLIFVMTSLVFLYVVILAIYYSGLRQIVCHAISHIKAAQIVRHAISHIKIREVSPVTSEV